LYAVSIPRNRAVTQNNSRLGTIRFYRSLRIENNHVMIRSIHLDMIGGVIARRTFILHSSPRPTIFLEWFVLAATIIALRRGERKLPLQVMVLMGTVWLVDLLGMARELQLPYFIFTDPLVIIAAALLIEKLVFLQGHRWAYPIGVSLIVAHITVSKAEPVKHAFLRTDGVEVICGLYHHAKRVERFPFCADRRN
jgi:hypothetical protein